MVVDTTDNLPLTAGAVGEIGGVGAWGGGMGRCEVSGGGERGVEDVEGARVICHPIQGRGG